MRAVPVWRMSAARLASSSRCSLLSPDDHCRSKAVDCNETALKGLALWLQDQDLKLKGPRISEMPVIYQGSTCHFEAWFSEGGYSAWRIGTFNASHKSPRITGHSYQSCLMSLNNVSPETGFPFIGLVKPDWVMSQWVLPVLV